MTDHSPWFIREKPNLRAGCLDCEWKDLIPGTDGDSHKKMRLVCEMHVREKRK